LRTLSINRSRNAHGDRQRLALADKDHLRGSGNARHVNLRRPAEAQLEAGIDQRGGGGERRHRRQIFGGDPRHRAGAVGRAMRRYRRTQQELKLPIIRPGLARDFRRRLTLAVNAGLSAGDDRSDKGAQSGARMGQQIFGDQRRTLSHERTITPPAIATA
jgi:hypothetical protein